MAKLTCFWCGKKYVDLIKHTARAHFGLTPRSYDTQELKVEMFGYTIENCKTDFHKSFGKYMAYKKDGSFSVHFGGSPGKALDRAMKELLRIIN